MGDAYNMHKVVIGKKVNKTQKKNFHRNKLEVFGRYKLNDFYIYAGKSPSKLFYFKIND